MKQISKIILSLSIILCGGFLDTIKSQVTIGSNTPPAEGVLLDLKQMDDYEARSGGRNSEKGLGLPRVCLETNKDIASLGVKDSEKEVIIGMLVYNTNEYLLNKEDRICKGLHVWSGDIWMPFIAYPASNSSVGVHQEPYQITDLRVQSNGTTELNKYWVTNFSVDTQGLSCDPDKSSEEYDAGWWMTDNLATKLYPDGTPILWSKTNDLTGSGASQDGQKRIFYPGGGNNSQTPPGGYKTQHGMLYTWGSAMNWVDDSSLESKQRGVCPFGWYVPNADDWKGLQKILDAYPEEFSTADKNEPFWAMLAASNLAGLSGKSKIRGLNLDMTGLAEAGSAKKWKTEGRFWTSTILPTQNSGRLKSVNAFVLPADKSTPYLEDVNRSQLAAIRCKKNMDNIQCEPDKTHFDEATGLLTDHEGNIYFTRNFGKAGRWMTQNLRTQTMFDNCQSMKIPFYHKDFQNKITFDDTYIFYPYGDSANPEITPIQWKPEYGMYYSQTTATSGHNYGVSKMVNDVENDDQIRGICPRGWHIPTDFEMNNLEEELALYPAKYSTNTNGAVSFPDSWRKETYDYRPVLSSKNQNQSYGVTMRSKNPAPILPGSTDPASKYGGKSFPYNAPLEINRGFDDRQLGYFRGEDKNFVRVGHWGLFWTSSNRDTQAVFHRRTDDQALGVFKGPGTKTHFFNVRCIQDKK